MNALTAPIQGVQEHDLLVFAPFFPLAAAVANGFFSARIERGFGRSSWSTGALAASAGALLVLVHAARALAGLEPTHRHLVQPLWSLARIGSLHATLSLAADPLSTTLAIGIVLLGLSAHLALRRRDGDHAKVHASIDLAVGSTLVALLAEGFVGFLLGFAGASTATFLLVAQGATRSAHVARAIRAFALARVADVALILAAVLLFWSLGGSWGIALGLEPTYTRRNPVPFAMTSDLEPDEFGPEGPPLLPVVLGTAPAASAPPPTGALPDLASKGHLTVAGWPGAKVFTKGSMLPSGIAPVVRNEVYAGRLDVEVEPAPGMRRVRLRAVEIPRAREVAIVPVGPTLVFRELRDQVVLGDASHQRFVRALLDPSSPTPRRIFGVAVGAVVSALLSAFALVAAFAGTSAAASRARASSSAIAIAVVPLAATYLFARLSFVVTLSGAVASLFGLVAAGAAFVALGAAALDSEPRRAVSLVASAHVCLGLSTIAVGAPEAGVGVALFGVLSSSALLLAAEARVRAGVRVAAFSLAMAPVPLLGASCFRAIALSRVMSTDLASRTLALVVLACAPLAAFAVVRTLALFESDDEEEKEETSARAPLLLAAFVAIAAPVLGASRESFGIGPERPLFEALARVDLATLLAERAPHVTEGGGAQLAAVAVAIALSIGAWTVARRRVAAGELPALPGEDKLVSGDDAWLPRVRSAIGAAVAALPRVLARLDEILFEAPARRLADLLLRVGGRRREP